MPFSAELRVPINGNCVELLCKSHTLRAAVQKASEWNGEIRIDIFPQLLLIDLYGRPHQQSASDVELWTSDIPSLLLVESEINSSKHEQFIGTWNLPLLRWLKRISLATGEMFTIEYDHERGDIPYEFAWWISSPVSCGQASETFGLASHEGMDEAEWKFEVRRFADGRSEFNECGQCPIRT